MERPHGDAGPHRIHHHKAMGDNVMSYAGWYECRHRPYDLKCTMRRIVNMLVRLWRWMLSRFGKPTMSNTEAWRALAERIIAKGKLIFDTSSVFQSEKG